MKKITSFLFLMLMATGIASAQPPAPQDVVAASKGQLPTTLPTVPPAQENVVPGLWLDNIGYEHNSYSSSYKWTATLTFGEYGYTYEAIMAYYAIEKKNANGGWDRVATLASNSVGYDVYDSGTYRLHYLDGDLIGKVTNEVVVEFPAGNCISKYHSWWRSDYEDPLVGIDVLGTLNVYVTNHTYGEDENTEVTIEDGYYHYQWYRRNPNTGQMTAIQGATMLHYIPTINDVGYKLVLEVTGDGTHCNFLLNIPLDNVVKLPVMASLDYVGADGFILNTDYVVNADDFVMNMEFYGEDEQPQSTLNISQREPGKYVFRGDMSEYEYGIVEHTNPSIFICFVYLMEQDWDEDGEMELIEWHREAQIMPDRYLQPLIVKPVYNGTPLSTTIEAYAPNIDGIPTLVGTAEAVDGDGASFDALPTLGGGVFVKALRTDNTSETYYPSVLLWEEATRVMPGFERDEDWNDIIHEYTIDVKPVFTPLTGPGVIEGTVNVTASANARHLAPANASGISVYLQKKGGNIIACEETDASGSYRFENVPLGTYEVLVNIDGCTQPSPTEVTLTSDNNTVTDIDYHIEDNAIVPGAESQGAATGISDFRSSQAVAGIYDLQGRRLNSLQKGVNIVKLPNGKTKQVLVR